MKTTQKYSGVWAYASIISKQDLLLDFSIPGPINYSIRKKVVSKYSVKWASLKNPYCSFCLENFLALSLPPKLVLIFQDPAQAPPFPGSLPWITQPNELTLP